MHSPLLAGFLRKRPRATSEVVFPHVFETVCPSTVRLRGIGTGISEASKRVPIFLHDVRGGKQVSSYF